MKRIVIVVVVVLLLPLLVVRGQQSTPVVPCKDRALYQNFIDDSDSIMKWINDLHNSAVAADRAALKLDATHGLVGAIGLRQKYEDITDIPAACKVMKSSMLVVIQHLNDYMAYVLAAEEEPEKQEEYLAQAVRQSQLFNEASNALTALIQEHNRAVLDERARRPTPTTASKATPVFPTPTP